MFAQFAQVVAEWAGRSAAFTAACVFIIAWAGTGPFFGWSDTWQLIINTSTTIVTFLMVFLLQHTQARDTKALHAKLDELIRCGPARDRYIGLDRRPEAEIEAARDALQNKDYQP